MEDARLFAIGGISFFGAFCSGKGEEKWESPREGAGKEEALSVRFGSFLKSGGAEAGSDPEFRGGLFRQKGDPAECAFRKDVENLALGCIVDLVVKAAGAIAFAYDGVGTVCHVTDAAEAGEEHLDGLMVLLVIRFLF